MTTPEVVDAGDWLVYGGGLKAVESTVSGRRREFSALFNRLYEISEPNTPPLIRWTLKVFRSDRLRQMLARMDLSSPYVQGDGLATVVEFNFGRRLCPKYRSPGSPYFYAIVGPVYEFLTRALTGLGPELEGNDVRQLGTFPVHLVRTDRLRPKVGLLGNDAIGRRALSSQMATMLVQCRAGTSAGALRVLAVGDGPALTTLSLAKMLAQRGVRSVRVTILDPGSGQIANGRRALGQLDTELKDKFKALDISVDWLQAGVEDMGRFEDSIFDLVFSSYVVGALGTEENAARYAREALRILKPAGKHFVLDFYEGNDDMTTAASGTNGLAGQRRRRAAARLLHALIDEPLHQCYRDIWGHIVGVNDAVIDASRSANATWTRNHRQTWFTHLPLLRLGKWTLTVSVPGYNEITSVFTKQNGDS